jgi:SpoIID/LytB domain protein
MSGRPVPRWLAVLWLIAPCALAAVAGAWGRGAVVAQATVTDSDLERASAGRMVRIGPSSGARPVQLPIEVYVARVIAGEGEPGAPDATQEALAIAIRTFAVTNQGRHAADGFDLCDTTHCQVPRAATPATRRAALATAGRVLTYNGLSAEVFYSASCGGHSESADQVWPGVNLPYLKSIVDDVHADDVPWTIERTLADIQRALTGAGFAGARLNDVVVQSRSESGRATRVGLPGLRPDSIAGDAFRGVLGATALRSTAFSVERHGSAIAFTGRGYGHGVGMCVIGAGRRARRGETAAQILGAYYPGAVLQDLGAIGSRQRTTDSSAGIAADKIPLIGVMPPPTVRPTPPAPVAEGAVSAAAPPRDVTAIVPSGAPAVVQGLEARAVRARDTVAAALGLAPVPVVVEVYDTSEAFRRATGQPWWVAFDQRAASIALGPTSLADADTLDAALRAAMAERLMAQALAGRPVWVRVGGGRYVARVVGQTPAGVVPKLAAPARAPEPGRRSQVCPADAELRLAVSAAAQREAEVRAEACFVRAFQTVRDWREVR